MPKRTNEYQKLILAINKHLADSKVIVTESKMFLEKESKSEREVDIVLEDKIASYSAMIGIECTAQSRKMNVNQISAFYEKHKNIGINKSIVVSMNGFSEPAKEFAISRHIELITFDNAYEKDWLDCFGDFNPTWIAITSHKFYNFDIKYKIISGDNFLINGDMSVIENNIKESIGNYLGNIINECPTKELSELTFDSELKQTLKFVFDPELIIIDSCGTEAACEEIKVECATRLYRKPLEGGVVDYAGELILHRKCNNIYDFDEVSVLVTEDGKKSFNVIRKK